MNTDSQTAPPSNDVPDFGSARPGAGRRWLRVAGLFALAGIVVAAAAMSVVFVDEGEYVIVERFGEIVAVYDRPEDRGFHWKLTWPIDSVRRFDRRVQLFDPPGREVFSRDKKNMTVSAYVCWRIAERGASDSVDFAERPVVRFFQNLGTIDVAEARLDGRVRSLLNTEIGRIELSALLNVADSNAGASAAGESELAAIAQRVRKKLETSADGNPPIATELGIEIVDLRIRRINFPLGNRQSVYDRMRSERKKEADEYRTAGLAENKAIRSRADLQYERILAKARADAERIRGTAKANATAIRNSAQARDPEFYTFLRTLETYEKILNEKTTLVLSSSSNLLKLLTRGIPDAPGLPPDSASPPAAAKKPNGIREGGE